MPEAPEPARTVGGKARCTFVALVGLVVLVPLLLPARAAAANAPSAVISSVAVKHTARAAGFAGAVDARLRMCLSVGPRAVVLVEETRMLGTLTTASERWRDPLGVDLDQVRPYACVDDYRLSWALKSRFVGPGTYAVRIRIRDGYGRLSKAVSFSLQPGLA